MLTFHRPQPMMRPLFAVLGALVVLLAGPSFGVALGMSTGHPWLAALAGLVVATVVLALLNRRWRRPTEIPPIRFEDDCVLLPRSASSDKVHRVPLKDLLSIDVRGTQKLHNLVIGARGRLFMYPLPGFVDPDAARVFALEARRRMALLPDGGQLLHEMDRRGEVTQLAFQTRPRLAHALVVGLAAVFALELALGVWTDKLVLLRLGANAPGLVHEGQWWRLASSTFLHLNLLHIYLNGMSLLALGAVLERLVGPWRLLVLFTAGALAGSAASALMARAVFSVGASTAVFGLIGALLVVNLRFRGELPGGFRQPLRFWVLNLGLNGALPLLVPQIDVAAHIGGFLGGALATVGLFAGRGPLPVGAPSPRLAKALAAACGAVLVVGAVMAGVHAMAPATVHDDEARRVLSAPRDPQPP